MGVWSGRATVVAAAAVLLVGSAARAEVSSNLGPRVTKRAERLVGLKKLSAVTSRVPDDCSGVVRWPYLREGVDLVEGDDYPPNLNAVTVIYLRAKKLNALTKSPSPGDLAFFRETYDRNGDGKRNDGLTHVALVESVADDGTVTLIHHGHSGVARTHVNLAMPQLHRDAEGKLVNDILVPAKKKGAPSYLTSQLFVTFARAEALKVATPPKAVATRTKKAAKKSRA